MYVKHIYIPFHKRYKSNKGLSERQLKKRLEKQGWEVWRGAMIRAEGDLYPNVQKKYDKLKQLLTHIDDLKYLCFQSGMPDFICYRQGQFKFVECKFNHETVKENQKRCILKLQQLGYEVEIHKFVEPHIRLREKYIDWVSGHSYVKEKQTTIRGW